MTSQLVTVLAMLASSIALFVIGRPRMDVVALLILILMPMTGVMTLNEALAGFADPSIILIGALFVIGEGLVRTGVARTLGDWLDEKGGNSEARLIILLMVSVGLLGAVMSSTAVVAMFIPVGLRIAQNRRIAPSQLMMPMSVAALSSGMLTLVATAPNMIVNAELIRQGTEGFRFFSFTPFGMPVLILGTLYMLMARRRLPVRAGAADGTNGRPTLRDWIERYNLAGCEQRLRVCDDSPLVGIGFGQLKVLPHGISLLAMERGSGRMVELLRPTPETHFAAGDILLMDIRIPAAEAEDLRETYRLELLPSPAGDSYFGDWTQQLGMVEVIVPPESPLIGYTIREARIRSEFRVTVIGLRQGSSVSSNDLAERRLKLGDTLLLTGFWSDIRNLRNDSGEIVLLDMPTDFNDVLPAASKAPFALGTLGLVIVLMVTGLVSNAQAALIGCLLMGLFGCVDFNSAYGSISWKTLILIIGMLPFSLALQRTGGVDLAANAMIEVFGSVSPHAVLAMLFVVTAALGLFISNTATAVLMTPIALAVAKDLNLSPYPFAMIIALAASTAFMTPISSPVNTLVVGPGGYKFGDFVKIGVPLSIMVAILCVSLVPLWLPFHQ